MANAIYPHYKQSLLNGDTNSDLVQTGASAAPFVALVTTSSGYTYSSTHQFYSDLSNIVGTDQQLTSLSVTNGTFSAANSTFTSVSGTVVGALVIYRKNSGANTTWRLVLYEDTGVTGLPVTPNGGNIVITWNGSGIFLISDLREKENVVHVGNLKGLSVCEYNYLGRPNEIHVGLIAQEVEKVIPDAVQEFRFGPHTRKAVNYNSVFEHLRLAA